MEFFGDDNKTDSSGGDDVAPDLLGGFIQELEETIANLEQKIVELETDLITSLTNKEVIKVAMSAGASAFIPKMHHQQVMQELKRIESGLDKAETTSKALDQAHKMSNRRLVTFSLGQHQFAMPMEVLKEVSHPSPSLPLPVFPEWMNKVTAFRGKMVPVIDLCKLFHLSSEDPASATRQQAIVDHDGVTVAVLFDNIGEVVLLSQLNAGEQSLSRHHLVRA